MKTALIAGVCLLALIVIGTDALQKKDDCSNLDDDVQTCVDATDPSKFDDDTVCTDRCIPLLAEYFIECKGKTLHEFNVEYNTHCGPFHCLIFGNNVLYCSKLNDGVCTITCPPSVVEHVIDCERLKEDPIGLPCSAAGNAVTLFTFVSAIPIAVGN